MIRKVFVCVLVCIATLSSALTQRDVETAKGLIRKVAGPVDSNQFLQFAGRMLQLWFHDCDTFGATFNGGPNGCVNSQSGANAGVLGIISSLNQIHSQMRGVISKADLIVLGASCVIMDSIPKGSPVGMDLLGNFMTGRPDKTVCDLQNVLPNPTGGVSTVQQAVSVRLGLTKAETVALMGAHTLGGAHTSISGFTGPFDDTPAVFDNTYYTSFLTKQWIRQQGQAGVFWSANDNSGTIRFNVDMALAIDTTNCRTNNGCPVQPQGTMDWIKLFASDAAQWHQNFASAFQKISSNGIRGLVPVKQLRA
ncbi:Ascorbate peroxidase [Achlya hypogyna]|uniref:Ascorbate peroxidase n=1 Tax=Achlya hypogyna TaxID=1202772 RepID=A0A0A7CPA0_ACHHY|nr:secreted protein [Achlya hypogyna]OQR84777.1 Ascorbate peroxidase [Achlya hypogyna]